MDGTKTIDWHGIFWEGAAYSEHAVGGHPAQPGYVAFGLRVLRRYAGEQRRTARFPPPPPRH